MTLASSKVTVRTTLKRNKRKTVSKQKKFIHVTSKIIILVSSFQHLSQKKTNYFETH